YIETSAPAAEAAAAAGLVRLLPVRAGADVDDQRNRQLRDAGHLFLERSPDAIELALRHLEYELVVDLKQELRRELVAANPVVHGDHRELDGIRRRPLHWRIDRRALGGGAARAPSGPDVGEPQPTPEHRFDVSALASGFARRLHVFGDTRIALE